MNRRWSGASVRLRLTAWYALVLFLVTAGSATATYLAVRHEFYEQLEDTHHADASSAESVQAQIREVLAVLALGLPLVVALSAIGGYALAGRALKPVEASFEKLRRFTADASHELRTIDLGDLARDTAGSLTVLADERSQRMTFDVPAPVAVRADPARAARSQHQHRGQRHQLQPGRLDHRRPGAGRRQPGIAHRHRPGPWRAG